MSTWDMFVSPVSGSLEIQITPCSQAYQAISNLFIKKKTHTYSYRKRQASALYIYIYIIYLFICIDIL